MIFVNGFCPACDQPTLNLDQEGTVECSNSKCPIPDAVHNLLKPFQRHFVVFNEESWFVEHDLGCRIRGEMKNCRYHQAIARVCGDFHFTTDLGRWLITDIDDMGLPTLERAEEA